MINSVVLIEEQSVMMHARQERILSPWRLVNLCVTLLLVVLANLTKFRTNLIKVIPAPRAIGIHPNPSPTRGHELTDEENRAL